jgi:hypothetical protein
LINEQAKSADERLNQIPDRKAKAIFFGTFEKMAKCQEPVVQEFPDSFDFEPYLGAQRPTHKPRFESA